MFVKLWFIVIAFFGANLFADKESDQFVVGTTSGYAPYVSLNALGEYEGFDIDLAHLVAAKMNKKLVLKDLGSIPSLLTGLQMKKIDAVIWAVSITEERQKEMAMVYYQGEKVTEMPFLFWKEIPQNIAKIEDLSKDASRSICVEAGSYQDAVMQKYPGIKLSFTDKVLDGIMKIKYGKSICTVVDPSLIKHLTSQYPELKVLTLPLPSDQQSLGNGICILKSNEKLVADVEKIVRDLRNEGKIAELEEKWNLAP